MREALRTLRAEVLDQQSSLGVEGLATYWSINS